MKEIYLLCLVSGIFLGYYIRAFVDRYEIKQTRKARKRMELYLKAWEDGLENIRIKEPEFYQKVLNGENKKC